ncbi:GNAT family N-acetyltransferase [Streptomyces platensis]
MVTLAGWFGAHHADRMYLQVEHDNTPTLRLYERAGFSEVSGYPYRTAA